MEQTSLFERSVYQPLAARLRPATLDEYVGQTHLLGPGKVLRRLIETDQISSMIFWGPPGVGKTTLARIIAHKTKASFIDFSAVTSGIKEIRAVMQQAEENRRFGERTIVFVDEIHRFNKAQQDAFLPFVEKGSSPAARSLFCRPSNRMRWPDFCVVPCRTRGALAARPSTSRKSCCRRWQCSPTGTPARPCPPWRWSYSTEMWRRTAALP